MRRKAQVGDNDLEKMIENIEKAGGDASELRRLREEMAKPAKFKVRPEVRPEAETINWTPQHEEFKQKIQFLIETQGLEVHPKLRPRLSVWIDAAIKRDYKCVMDLLRGCPCEEPAKWGCPLLRK